MLAGEVPVLVHNTNLRPCDEWADSFISRVNGGVKIRITPPQGGSVLGPVRGYEKGDWDHHIAVLKDGKVYDQRNPGGVTPEEFKSQFEYADVINFGGL